MKGFSSVLMDRTGKPLGEVQERAHVLSQAYAVLGKDYLDQGRKLKMWGYILLVLLPVV